MLRFLWYVINAVCLNSYLLPISGVKVVLLRVFGAKIGKGVVIKPKVNIKYPWKLEIGNNAWLGERVWIDNLGKVSIGENCCLSQGSFLLCGNHDYSKESFDLMVGDITLEEGVWIGAMSTVGPGVTCHSHSVLAANSFSSKDLKAFGIYRGNPAELVKERSIQ